MFENSRISIRMLQMLMSKLDNNNRLEVMGEDATNYLVSFSFGEHSDPKLLKKIEQEWKLPRSYKQFLEVYNGALLYKDMQFGQWGFRLYQIEELLYKNNQWHALYNDIPTNYLVFAECLGDTDLLLLDTSYQGNDPEECHVIDGDTAYPVRTWQAIARNFDEWICHLILAQGAKYWRWKLE